MAYEVRISDWRSDVCSSDRRHFVGISANPQIPGGFGIPPERVLQFWDWVGGRYSLWSAIGLPIALGIGIDRFHQLLAGAHEMDVHFASAPPAENLPLLMGLAGIRSEEHTSELQSLMRTSYAVLCLKKNTKHKTNQHKQI